MSFENNENKAEGQQNGGKSGTPLRKKLSVVIRTQNSSTLKDLPKVFRGADSGTGRKKMSDQKNEASAKKPVPRPLPAGTKPVKPAVFGIDKEDEIIISREREDTVIQDAAEIKTPEKAAEPEIRVSENPENAVPETSKVSPETAAADSKPSDKDTADISAESCGSVTEDIPAENKPAEKAPADSETGSTENTAAEESVKDTSGKVPEKSGDTARSEQNESPSGKPSANRDEKKSAKSERQPKTARTEKKAETAVSASGSALLSGDRPQVRIVKSYANYDAQAIIRAATKAQQDSMKSAENDRRTQQRGQRPQTGTAQRQSGQDGQGLHGKDRTQIMPGQRRATGTGKVVTMSQRGTEQRGQSGQGQRNQQGASRFEGAASGKPQNGRGKANFQGKDRFDRKDKFADDIQTRTPKTGKGAFIKPEPRKEKPEDDIKVIVIPESLSIKELADKLRLQPSVIIKKLFLDGKMCTPNSDLSYDEAESIAMDYDILCEKEEKEDVIAELLKDENEDEAKLKRRPPVVCVMGHVDHGKTSLLDAIRNTNVTSHEAGGITQHIGASVVKCGDRTITFLDTPGHEAFTAMRLRGAQSTDIAVLVVAADDGVKPQTVEAISHAKSAGVQVVVAINKIDKPAANIDKVKKELADYGLISEEWGGTTTMVPVSAKTGEGIDDLLEMLILEADVLELRADPDRNARGIVIEAELDKGRGPVATVLVQKGTLRVGDNVAAGACYGKVRAMIDDKGNRIRKATPSTPVEILGLNDVPNAGEVFLATSDEKEARNIAETFISEHKKQMLEETRSKMNLTDLFDEIKAGNIKELPIIVKADVQGSVEAVKQSLGKLSNEEVAVKVIHSGVGNINESDVNLASAGNAIIIGFNVKPDTTAKSIAENENVEIRLYRVIYQAIEDIEAALNGMLAPVYEEQVTGHAVIRQIFKASGVGNIAGCYVLDGIVERGSRARIKRGNKQIFDGDIASLKRFKDEVKEVKNGFECGMVFEEYQDVEVDDSIEIYKMIQVIRTAKKDS